MLPAAPNCSPSNYPDHTIYKLVMNAIGVSQIPFFCLSVYCILNKSLWSMGSYKWLILKFQLSIITFNLFVTMLSTPIVFYPFLCGYPTGWLSALNVPARLQYLATTFALSCVGSSTICLFEYRHQTVLPTFHALHQTVEYRVFKTTMYYLIGLFHVWLPAFFVDIDDRPLIMQIVDDWKQAPCDIWHGKTVVLSVQTLGFLHFYYMAGIGVVVLMSTCYALHSFYIIRATRILLSREMQRIQRTFMKGLLLQVLIPYSALVLPAALGLVVLLLTENYNQTYVQFGVCLLSTHGLLSTITTILVHQSYRNYLFFLCRRMFLPMGMKISTVDEFTTLPNLRKLGTTHTIVTKF